jgi:predicted CXXCH cytochrome family protein
VIRSLAVIITCSAATTAAFAQGQSVVDTAHNLSASGPGGVRATSEARVCIFCHTPHNATPIRPLWNRELPLSTYNIYSSNALDALPGQPTGASKMCLSCHDGTIALGSVVSDDQVIQMAGGITTLPPGSSNLGTDLSDDHPISFRFDSALAFKDAKLVNPEALPDEIRLDGNQEVQCTTCHDAHDNSFGGFLVMGNQDSAMCRSCHQISSTSIAAHENCVACHKTHTAPSGPYLLANDRVRSTCLDCHDGSTPAADDIESVLELFSVHDTNSPVDPVDPIPGHVTCADCHDPHTMTDGTGLAPTIHPNFGEVSGVSGSGAALDIAGFEYEVCFKCHGDVNAIDTPWVPRYIVQTNTRLEFAQNAISFHPVQGPGRNPDVPSLKPGYDEGSVLYCSDCHGSNLSTKAGGSGPDGVHGSNEPPMLIARYETSDLTPESASSYALCYRCHERTGPDGILSDRSFPHSVHLDDNIACATCHDAHGISSAQGTKLANSHLINFDNTVVFPAPGNPLPFFQDLGTFSGSCTLSCHGTTHSATEYVDGGGPGSLGP